MLAPENRAKAAAGRRLSPTPRAARHALAAFKGHYVLLNLWATWCAPCVAELPSLAKLQAAVPGLTVLAVDVGRDKADAAGAFLKSHNAGAAGHSMWIPTSALMRSLRRLWPADHGADRSQGQGGRPRRRARRMGVAGGHRLFQEI